MTETPLTLLVDGGPLAPLAAALRQIGREVLVRPDFDQVIASLSSTAGAVVYFDPSRTLRPERFGASVRNAGTVVLLVAVFAQDSAVASGPPVWNERLNWPIGPASLREASERHLDQARVRRMLFDVGSRFAQGLHDIRTPLGGIKGYASTLNAFWDRMAESDRRDAIQIIEAEVDRVTELLEDLSRVERDLRRGEWQG